MPDVSLHAHGTFVLIGFPSHGVVEGQLVTKAYVCAQPIWITFCDAIASQWTTMTAHGRSDVMLDHQK